MKCMKCSCRMVYLKDVNKTVGLSAIRRYTTCKIHKNKGLVYYGKDKDGKDWWMDEDLHYNG